MTADNFCFYLQNRLIQTSQTGGQQYSDTSPFSIPWQVTDSDKRSSLLRYGINFDRKKFKSGGPSSGNGRFPFFEKKKKHFRRKVLIYFADDKFRKFRVNDTKLCSLPQPRQIS